MGKKFKDYYDGDCARLYVEKLSKVCPTFAGDVFISEVTSNLEGKELLARQDVFVRAFQTTLTGSYAENIAVFQQILGPELPTAAGMYNTGWWLWPVGRYVEKLGHQGTHKDFQTSMAFLKELTKRFTGEFAIRPLISRYPQKALKMMGKWSQDDNVHVRRLASEGLRIRLPWAKKMDVALVEFEAFKRILSNLKNDSEKFVQKSVGNNLNDLYKEAPEKLQEIIQEWQMDNPGKATLWMIKHGLRSERKKAQKAQKVQR